LYNGTINAYSLTGQHDLKTKVQKYQCSPEITFEI